MLLALDNRLWLLLGGKVIKIGIRVMLLIVDIRRGLPRCLPQSPGRRPSIDEGQLRQSRHQRDRFALPNGCGEVGLKVYSNTPSAYHRVMFACVNGWVTAFTA